MTNLNEESFIGSQFGKLKIISFTNCKRSRDRKAICDCVCGGESQATLSALLSGKRKSCGCDHRHHNKRTPEHYSWGSMISRCYNPNKNGYHRYGGRGITVCDRWRASVNNFISDMGRRPTPQHTLDRINSDGNYCLENCRWADLKQQNRNKSSNKMLEYNGRLYPMVELSEIAGITAKLMKERIKSGWSVEKAMFTPLNTKYSSAKGYK